MATYIHQLLPWPRFRWSDEEIAKELSEVRHRQGLLIGQMKGLGFRLQKEAVLSTLTEEVLKSSEIEGEILDRGQVARPSPADWGWMSPACPPPTAMLRALSK